MAQSTTEKNVSKAKTTAKQQIDKVPNDLGMEDTNETVKNTALAGLGVVGKLIDSVKNRAADVREAAPKKWDEFVQRGEQIKDNTNVKVNNVRFTYKFDMAEQRAQFQDVIDALRAFVKPAKADVETSKA